MSLKKIRVLIIDDEEPARVLLRSFLHAFDDIEIVSEYSDGFQGVKAIQEHTPDLILLDIQMPRLNGFEMLELVDKWPEIIFTTAYDEYAIKAFELNAVDYLMKPFSRQRLRQALDKAIHRLATASDTQGKVKKLIDQLHVKDTPIERIVVKAGSKIHIIAVQQIEHIEAQDDYVKIHTQQGRFLKKETMQRLEEQLPQDSFIRVHRSHIVHINQIHRIEQYGKESYLLLLKNGNQAHISKSRLKDLKRELDF
ncbi:MAG: LytTR family DNA-binding domain-containing protein [Bacteroidales bacterium]|nr:LytTR family DNA-binding domain-containing protein [Bacteroidales bacterium]